VPINPKGPPYLIKQHSNFGHVRVIHDFHLLGRNLLEGVDEEYLSCVLKFRTFGNMSQKLWSNMLLFS